MPPSRASGSSAVAAHRQTVAAPECGDAGVSAGGTVGHGLPPRRPQAVHGAVHMVLSTTGVPCVPRCTDPPQPGPQERARPAPPRPEELRENACAPTCLRGIEISYATEGGAEGRRVRPQAGSGSGSGGPDGRPSGRTTRGNPRGDTDDEGGGPGRTRSDEAPDPVPRRSSDRRMAGTGRTSSGALARRRPFGAGAGRGGRVNTEAPPSHTWRGLHLFPGCPPPRRPARRTPPRRH